jgi:hypothetical protein
MARGRLPATSWVTVDRVVGGSLEDDFCNLLSTDPDGSRLQYPMQSWQSFVATIKNERIFGK